MGSLRPRILRAEMRSAIRAAVGVLFPLAMAAAVVVLLARLAGHRVGPVVLGLALAGLLLGAVIAAALTAIAAVRRQWWWAGSLLVLWPVTVPLYLRHLRRSRDRRRGDPGASPDPEV